MLRKIIAAGFAAALSIAPAAAVEDVDFENTPSGFYYGQQRFGLFFLDASGDSTLWLGDFNVQSHGKALAVMVDGQYFVGRFQSSHASYLSFEFGNDDPDGLIEGDLARLQVFSVTNLGTQLQATIDVVPNRDDIMNQTISYNGLWNMFTFAYVDASGNPAFRGGGEVEVIDNLTVNYPDVVSSVPEPATWGLLLLGFGSVGAAMRARGRSKLPAA